MCHKFTAMQVLYNTMPLPNTVLAGVPLWSVWEQRRSIRLHALCLPPHWGLLVALLGHTEASVGTTAFH